jgi:hypothetical protein
VDRLYRLSIGVLLLAVAGLVFLYLNLRSDVRALLDAQAVTERIIERPLVTLPDAAAMEQRLEGKIETARAKAGLAALTASQRFALCMAVVFETLRADVQYRNVPAERAGDYAEQAGQKCESESRQVLGQEMSR